MHLSKPGKGGGCFRIKGIIKRCVRTETRPIIFRRKEQSKLKKKAKTKKNRFHCFEGVEKYESTGTGHEDNFRLEATWKSCEERRQKRNAILVKKEVRHVSCYKLFWCSQLKRGCLGNVIIMTSRKNKK